MFGYKNEKLTYREKNLLMMAFGKKKNILKIRKYYIYLFIFIILIFFYIFYIYYNRK